MKNKSEAAKESEAMVYLGPSFYGVAQKGMVLKGGYPPKFKALMDANPFVWGLMVPAGNLADKRKQLTDKESELALLYRRAEQINFKEVSHV